MDERFQTLYKLKNNLYTQGSPIVISACALLKDKKTENIITLFKFLSVSDKRIIALKITLVAFDILGNPIKKVNEYQYLDLNIYNGCFFGSDKAIIMPDNITRKIAIEKITVVFDDGVCDLSGADFSPFEKQEKLDTALTPELVKQYQIDAVTPGEYIPKKVQELWLCSCQTPNATSTCALCGAKKDKVFSAYDSEKLDINLKMRIAQQKEFEEERRKQNEENLAKEQAEKRKKKKLSLIIGISVALILSIVIATNAVTTKVHYNRTISEIDSYIEKDQYEQAFDAINLSNLSYEDKEIYREKVIPHMQALHEEIRNSEKETLAVVLDEVEYYIVENAICSKVAGEGMTILYETSNYNDYLRSSWSVYANGCLFFVEGHKHSYTYTAKYIDLNTGEIETLGSSDSRGDIVKLNDGSIFIGQNILDFNEGIWYNPYTQSKYIGEDAVSDGELEDAIYMN